MDSLEYCPHRVLQELLLNWSFSKIELAKFIRSHTNQITAALNASPKEIEQFFKPNQIEKMIRIFRHMQQYDSNLHVFFQQNFFNAMLDAQKNSDTETQDEMQLL